MSAAAVAWFHLQLEEAEAICAAYEDDCDFIWLHKPEGPDDGETAYAVTVRGKVDAETSVTFMITLPHGYPSAGEEKAFPEITAVEGSENVKYKLGNLQELLAANVRSQMKSAYEFPVLAALAPISDRLTKLGEEWQTKQQEEMAAKEDYDSVVRAAVKAKKSELQKGPLMLGRRMIFFHHIRSPYKRRCIQKWANDLRLGGMSKIGFPGCIVVEGDERDVSEYVNMVSKLIWRLMEVRGDEQIPVPPGKTLDDLRKLPIEFHEYGKDEFNEVAERCREAGLEDLFLTCMQIYGGKEGASTTNKKKSKKNRNDDHH